MQFHSMNLSLREILVTDTWFFHSEAAIIVSLEGLSFSAALRLTPGIKARPKHHPALQWHLFSQNSPNSENKGVKAELGALGA